MSYSEGVQSDSLAGEIGQTIIPWEFTGYIESNPIFIPCPTKVYIRITQNLSCVSYPRNSGPFFLGGVSQADSSIAFAFQFRLLAVAGEPLAAVFNNSFFIINIVMINFAIYSAPSICGDAKWKKLLMVLRVNNT